MTRQTGDRTERAAKTARAAPECSGALGSDNTAIIQQQSEGSSSSENNEQEKDEKSYQRAPCRQARSS